MVLSCLFTEFDPIPLQHSKPYDKTEAITQIGYTALKQSNQLQSIGPGLMRLERPGKEHFRGVIGLSAVNL